jgi:hypothetical protein
MLRAGAVSPKKNIYILAIDQHSIQTLTVTVCLVYNKPSAKQQPTWLSFMHWLWGRYKYKLPAYKSPVNLYISH